MTQAFNRDCMEAMREFPDKFFDLAVVDPPYGISVTSRHVVRDTDSCSQSGHVERERERRTVLVGGAARPFGGKKGVMLSVGKSKPCESSFYHAFDDSSPPDAEYFRELTRVSKSMVIWGGNFFLDHLGPASCMIVWDKKRRGMDQADCEIAWTNLSGQNRIIDFRWNGMLQGDMKNKENRIHPTQKPVRLYEWIYDHYAKEGDKILDTHLGSGSSRIAAHNRGLDFWGYEIDKVYFDLQEKRFEDYTAQGNLFLMET